MFTILSHLEPSKDALLWDVCVHFLWIPRWPYYSHWPGWLWHLRLCLLPFSHLVDSCETAPCPFIAVMIETCWPCCVLSGRFPASLVHHLLQCCSPLFCFVLLFLLLLVQPHLFVAVCCEHSALLLLRAAGWMCWARAPHSPALGHCSPALYLFIQQHWPPWSS